MKWYNYRNPYTDKENWWTQRDANGISYEIKALPKFSPVYTPRFVLFRCDSTVAHFPTLAEAMATAERSIS